MVPKKPVLLPVPALGWSSARFTVTVSVPMAPPTVALRVPVSVMVKTAWLVPRPASATGEASAVMRRVESTGPVML